MTASDWLKLAVILPVFFGLGPVLGAAVKDRPGAQRWLFAAMCFMTINGLFGPGNWGLTLASVETYRGHAKGYHFYFNHVFAIALITAQWLRDRKTFRWVPPGMLLYALFIVCCTLSITNSPRVDYTLMAIHKMVFFAVVSIAAFNCLRGAEDLQFFLKVMAVTMCWQALMVLKMKYLQGIYQVRGTFEHQNPLAMYAIMAGMPFLAATLGPDFRGRRWCTAGFIACAIIVQCALSRAALLMFAGGTLMVALFSILEKPTRRRFAVLGGLGFAGALGLLLTLDTIVARFGDKGNTASSELRTVLNEAARQMQQAHPLGIGWNNYALCINAPFPYADVVYEWTAGRGMKVDKDKPNAPVESHYYLLLGENGYAGLWSWLLLIGVSLWRNFRGFLAFRHGFERCLCLGLLAGCSLNYVQSTLERVLTQPRNLMLWLIIYGVTARLEVMRRAARKKGKGRAPETAPAPANAPEAPVPATAGAAPVPPRSLPGFLPPVRLPVPGGVSRPSPSLFPVPVWAECRIYG